MKVIRHNKHKVNVGGTERIISMLAGGALVYFGMKRRSLRGAGLAAVGGELIHRGVSGHCKFYQLTGIHTADRSRHTSVPYPLGIRVDRSVFINRPPEELYRFWRNLENLPKFMHHLKSVRSLDEKRSHWIAKAPAGRTVEWDAEIVNEKENELIGWRSLPGSDVESGGSVHFDKPLSGRGAIVKVAFQYNPPGGLLGAAFAKLFGEEPGQQVAEDLRRFKQLMEAGEIPTTEGQSSGRAWESRPVRGRMPASAVEGDLVEHASVESFPASDSPTWSSRQDQAIEAR